MLLQYGVGFGAAFLTFDNKNYETIYVVKKHVGKNSKLIQSISQINR